MFPISLLSWWYLSGWSDQRQLIAKRLSRVSDFFSIALLIRSLFAPFRQTFADVSGTSFDAKLRAWADKSISRGIGAMVRSVIILVGLLALFLECLFGLLRLIVWPLIPVLPFIGLILAILGWIPWKFMV